MIWVVIITDADEDATTQNMEICMLTEYENTHRKIRIWGQEFKDRNALYLLFIPYNLFSI
jgi:hypothetical protein